MSTGRTGTPTAAVQSTRIFWRRKEGDMSQGREDIQLEEMEYSASSQVSGDKQPLMGDEEPSSGQQPPILRTSILTRSSSATAGPPAVSFSKQNTITRETNVTESEVRSKSTYTGIVKHGNIDPTDEVAFMPAEEGTAYEKQLQEGEAPTHKDVQTRERQAQLRRLDEIEAADNGYTPRLNTEDLERAEETLFFQELDPDTKRSRSYRIDYVLVYSEEDGGGRWARLLQSVKRGPSREEVEVLRERFLEAAREMGLKVQEQPKELSEDQQTTFVWVHCPWQLMMEGAEKIGLKMPVDEKLSPLSKPWHQGLIERYTPFHSALAPRIPEDFQVQPYLSAPFKKDYQEQFIECDEHNQDRFFTSGQRAMVVSSLLDGMNFSPPDRQDKTIFSMGLALELGLFKAHYPLHDGPYTPKRAGGKIQSERQLLFREWLHPRSWLKTQPLHQIQRYLGIQVALYFAFLGHLTTWLLYASVVGVAVMIYGVTTLVTDRNPAAADTCGVPRSQYVNTSSASGSMAGGGVLGAPNSTSLYMCPLCDVGCDFWFYQSSCLSIRFSLLFDNGGTVFFAAFMSLWAVLFLEFWKRKQYRLQHEWGVLEYELVDETPRPNFLRRITREMKRDPVTDEEVVPRRYLKFNQVFGRYEIVQPKARFVAKVVAAFSALGVVVVAVVGIILAVLVYRAGIALVLYIPLAQLAESFGVGSFGGTSVNLIVLITAACIQLVAIMVMNIVYKYIAVFLNNWEMHRTQTDYEDSLVWKLYIFQFVNYYGSIFYIAFFKGNVVGYPGNYSRFGPIRLEECATYGCMLELTVQLVIILCGKQVLSQGVELGLPLLKWLLVKVRTLVGGRGDKDPVYARWERDYDLAPQAKFGLLPEFLELAVQYGFVTLFVAAFPPAPLFAFLNNLIEVRLDAYKYLVATRRPVPKRAEDIGAWYGILALISKVAVISNAFLIAFSSDFIPQLVYKYGAFSPEACARYPWPSCSIQNEFSGLGGYLDFRLGEFPVAAIFDEIRGCSLSSSNCSGSQVVPRIDIYRLRAVEEQPGGEVQQMPYLYLPFLDLTCLSARVTNDTHQRVATAIGRNESRMLLYSDFTPEVASVPDLYQNVPHCIYHTTQCSFRGYGNNGPGGRIPYENALVLIGRLAFVIVFEHVIFALVALFAIIVPDIPKRVKDEIRREKVLAQAAKVTAAKRT